MRRQTPALLLVLSLVVLTAVAGSSLAGGIECMGREATIVDGPGDSQIRGTSLDDVIVAGAGNDDVHAGRGADVVCGRRGNDQINGGPAPDDWCASDPDPERRCES